MGCNREKARGRLAGIWRIGIGSFDHELHQMVPIIERQVVDQHPQMFEECPSRRERVANSAVGGIDPVKRGVNQEGQQDHGRKQVSKDTAAHGRSGVRSASPWF